MTRWRRTTDREPRGEAFARAQGEEKRARSRLGERKFLSSYSKRIGAMEKQKNKRGCFSCVGREEEERVKDV